MDVDYHDKGGNFNLEITSLRWHFDFCTAKIGMPQKKGLKKDDGVRGRRKKIPQNFFPSSLITKQPLSGTEPKNIR